MDLKQLAPWNWFKNEEESSVVPVRRAEGQTFFPESAALSPMIDLHREMNRIFDSAFRGFGLSPFGSELFTPLTASGQLKPQVDISATDKEYCITVKVPGVSEKDVKVEIAENVMTIRGEKKQEKEDKGENYYRMERAYGSFQRVLSLPEDAAHENVKATFKNGVLTLRVPRREIPKVEVKKVEIKSAD